MEHIYSERMGNSDRDMNKISEHSFEDIRNLKLYENELTAQSFENLPKLNPYRRKILKVGQLTENQKTFDNLDNLFNFQIEAAKIEKIYEVDLAGKRDAKRVEEDIMAL